MKRIIFILPLACCLFACKPKAGHETEDKPDLTAVKAIDDTAKVTPPDKLIEPGKGIGQLLLNGNADSAATLLGKPDFSDAAMGSVLMTWYVRHDTAGYKTSIFANHNFGAKDERVAHIRKILVTAPGYKTADGLGTGMGLYEYQKHFDLKAITSYKAKGKKVKVYEAKGKGIAFEVDSASGKGVAIVVHKPGDSLATYINMQ